MVPEKPTWAAEQNGEVPAPLIGIDLLEPERLRDRLERTPNLLSDLFTSSEIAYCQNLPARYEHLAARFCAKEAVAKALGLDGFDPLEIEVAEGGETVRLVLYGAVLDHSTAIGVGVTVSLTHLPGM